MTNNSGTQSLQISQVEQEFLFEVRLMLQTLGVDSKVVDGVPAGVRLMPKNDMVLVKMQSICVRLLKDC